MTKRLKQILAFGGGALAVTALMGYRIWSSYVEAIRSAEATSQNYAALIEARLDATFRRAEAHVQELARSIPAAAMHKQADPKVAQAINRGLDLRQRHFPELVGLRVWDAEGDLIYSSDGDNTARINVADRPYFQASRKSTNDHVFYSDAVVSRITGKPTMFVGRAVRNADGAFLGVVSATFDLVYFQRFFESLEVGSSGSIAVVRRDDFTLAVRWPVVKDSIGKPLPANNPIRMAVSAGKKSGTLEFQSSLDTYTRIFSYRVLEQHPFYVGVGVPSEEVLAGWWIRSWIVGIATLLLLALLALLLNQLFRAETSRETLNSELELRVANRTLELEIAKTAAEAATLAKSQFLANMSHEIRTPMNGVLGMSELLLLDEQLTESQLSHVQAIHSSGDALLTVINDILDFSKIEAGKLALDPADVDIHALAHDLVRLLMPRAGASGIDLTCQIAAGVPKHIHVDPGRIRQILLNFLSNALKFTREGGVTLLIDTEAAASSPAGTTLRFTVADSGIGISAVTRARLFQPFTQADASTTREFGGTGLGLALTRQLADLMGGTVGVESEQGKGSRFWFVLPVEVLAPEAAPAPAAPKALPVDFPGVQILLAEDNPMNQTVAQMMLEAVGCEVTLANDGREAVAACQAAKFALVLMDCQMPNLDGFEATRTIRASEAQGQTRTTIIALTANAMAGDREQCLTAGMDDYLSKPLKRAALRAMLERWITPVALVNH